MNWDTVDLAIFDVDGTLYDQKRMRARMAAALAGACMRDVSMQAVLVLRTFRQVREDLGNRPAGDFRYLQYELTARRCRRSVDDVRAIVREWIEERPLPRLKVCRLAGVPALFSALRRGGKTIGIFSDYPAQEKLAALDLVADFVVSAEDGEVGRLKPDPEGLHRLLDLAGVSVERAIMIGDRADRDGEAARRAGMRVLIRSKRAHAAFDTFRSYSDAAFLPLFASGASGPAMTIAGRRGTQPDPGREVLL